MIAWLLAVVVVVVCEELVVCWAGWVFAPGLIGCSAVVSSLANELANREGYPGFPRDGTVSGAKSRFA